SLFGKRALADVRRSVDGDRGPAVSQRAIDGLDDPDYVEPEAGRRSRLLPAPDGAAEVGELELKRLGYVDAGRDNVAGSVSQPELAERLRIGDVGARVENAHRLVARVVVDDHLPRADDGRPPQLARRQPGHLDVG